jgi:hypothetical protein
MILGRFDFLSANILGGFGGEAPPTSEPLRVLHAQKARQEACASALNSTAVPTREAPDDLA